MPSRLPPRVASPELRHRRPPPPPSISSARASHHLLPLPSVVTRTGHSDCPPRPPSPPRPPPKLTAAPQPPSWRPLPPLRLIDVGSPSTVSTTVDSPGEPPSNPSFTSNQSATTLSCFSRRPPLTSPPAWPETAGPPLSSRHGRLPCFTVGCQPRDRPAHES
jgi:hypothetical protein